MGIGFSTLQSCVHACIHVCRTSMKFINAERMVNAYNPNTWKVREEDQKFKIFFHLCHDFKASLGYMKSYFQKFKKKKKGKDCF